MEKVESNSMIKTSLKSKLDFLKSKLQNAKMFIDSHHTQDKSLNKNFYVNITEKAENLLNNQSDVILKIIIGGKEFETFTSTILKYPTSLIASIITSPDYSNDIELIFDRSPLYFEYLLHYMRYGIIHYKKLNSIVLENIRREAEYFEICELADYLNQKLSNIMIVGFEQSGNFVTKGNKTAGTNVLDDIKNKSLKKGAICTNSPGWIIFELNCDWDIDNVELGPFIGDTELGWKGTYGIGAKIYSSFNKITWNDVGTIPNTFNSKIINIPLVNCRDAKYIKIQSTNSCIGFAYVNFNKLALLKN
jgi:hypothetical protein